MAAIKQAMSAEHHQVCKKVNSPYGGGHAAERIADKVVKIVLTGNIDLKKKFYDLENA